MFLDVSEKTTYLRRDYVLCFWTYLRRLCSVFLDVSVSDVSETMFCVTARI